MKEERNRMKRWSAKQAREWYDSLPWLVGCNFIPSTAINQLEMWQAETYDPRSIDRELNWAKDLGFNTIRVYLHDLLWSYDRDGFIMRIYDFLGIADHHKIKVIFVLFDDCHGPDPQFGPQPLPIRGVHNSGWKQSPGRELVLQFHDNKVSKTERIRLQNYVHSVLTEFSDDKRILMWDIYNEPGASNYGDRSNELLKTVWEWAQTSRPSQPLTSCLDGSVGQKNYDINKRNSDIVTFHGYGADLLEKTILNHKDTFSERPIICTEYMAREFGTTFQYSLPIFKAHRVGCFNWGLVAGKSQTHFNYSENKAGVSLKPGDAIPEPTLWFHDIFRVDGTPFDQSETDFIKNITEV